MLPIEFNEQNAVLAKNQPEYMPLPVHIGDGVTTSCWRLGWRERIKMLFSGKVYLQIMTFHNPLQPQRLTVENPLSK